MPQTRTLLNRTDTLMVERVVLHASRAQWSPDYTVPTPRSVLASSGPAIDFRSLGKTVLLDAVTMLCLPAHLSYQMWPWPSDSSCVSSASIVASRPPEGRLPLCHAPRPVRVQPQAAADSYILSSFALWQLRLHWHGLAVGQDMAQSSETVLNAALQSAHRPGVVGGQSHAAVQRAQRFMAQRTAAADACPWTLHDAADAACCSLFYLSRQFRLHMGLSLHGYRQRLRLATALQRLEGGERDLAALAHEVGYCSQSHMGLSFQREIGITPAHARRELTR